MNLCSVCKAKDDESCPNLGHKCPRTSVAPPDLEMHKASKKQAEMIEMLASVQHLRDNMAAIREYQEVAAQVKRNKYLSLIKEGFTETQALELCNNTDLL